MAGRGDDDGVAAGSGAGTGRGRLVRAGAAASVWAAGAAWLAVDGTVIIPFTAQLAMLRNPIPAARTKNRRRQ